MEDLLIAHLQAVFEFALEVLSNVPFGWPSGTEPKSLPRACLGWFAAGCVLGMLSIWLLRRTWISFPSLRIANLMLAPLTSAYVAQSIARRKSSPYTLVVPRNHFWRSFWFTLGLVLVRFAYASRS